MLLQVDRMCVCSVYECYLMDVNFVAVAYLSFFSFGERCTVATGISTLGRKSKPLQNIAVRIQQTQPNQTPLTDFLISLDMSAISRADPRQIRPLVDSTRWGIITGTHSVKWQNFITTLFVCIKIHTIKHKINAACNFAKLTHVRRHYRVISAYTPYLQPFLNGVCRGVGSRNNQHPLH